MTETFTIPLNIMRHVNWDKLMSETIVGAERITITAIRIGHGEELVGYEFKIDKGG